MSKKRKLGEERKGGSKGRLEGRRKEGGVWEGRWKRFWKEQDVKGKRTEEEKEGE